MSGNNIGLFSQIIKGDSNELVVSNLGVEEANINGEGNVGIIAGRAENASFWKVWTSGRVVGDGDNVGGLIGSLGGNRGSTIRMSWSTADVEGGDDVGGLSGSALPNNVDINFHDNWIAGNVSGDQYVGGFVGRADNNVYARNWSSGAVLGDLNVGGFVGASVEMNGGNDNYWNLDTSGVTESADGDGVTLQTLTAGDFDGNPTNAWDFGRNNGNDFPLLTDFSRPLQAVYLTRALTRILPLSDNLARDALTAGSEQALEANGFRLDTNGLAANDGSDSTSIPTCSFDSGVLRAITNYNGTAVEMSLLADNGERLTLPSGCDVKIGGVTDVFDATLRLEISAPEGNATRRLTVDYGVRIAPLLEFDDFPNPATVAANAARNTQVLTISVNQSEVIFTLEDNDSANFAIDGSSDGSSNEVTINIRNLATEVFDGDGKRATIIVAATRRLTNTNNLTVIFVSAPLAISSADSFIDINIMNASVGATILASINSGLTIWHNDNDDEFYTINSAGNFLTVGGTSGDVTAVEDLQIGVDYVATLSLTDRASGVAAMRVLTVSVSEGLVIRTPRQPVAVALGVTRDTAVYTAILLGGEDDRRFDSVSTGDFQTGGGEDEAEITITRAADGCVRYERGDGRDCFDGERQDDSGDGDDRFCLRAAGVHRGFVRAQFERIGGARKRFFFSG